MSRTVTLNWLGGEHEFLLAIGEMRAVQDACNAGPMEILNALSEGRWRVEMLMAVLRHGLIGAGMERAAAKELVSRMFDEHPFGKFVTPAIFVLAAAVVGVPDDPLGEPEGAATMPPES